jgi:hypothetical protein
MNKDIASATLMGITTSVGLYTAFLPKITEIRNTSPVSSEADAIRLGELAAGALTIGVGLTASSMTRSPYPFVLSIVAALAMVCMYETVLNSYPSRGKAT